MAVVLSATLLGAASFWSGGASAATSTTSTVVGGGSARGLGDGGSAVDASLEGPRMVAFDGRGGYYIADTYHHRIRHVDAAGLITTFAGAGRKGFVDGPAEMARFDAPHSVSVDRHGNVIVGDPMNNRVRMINAQTREVTTIAGTGSRSYGGDGGPATAARLNDSKIALVGPDHHIYIADYGNSLIRRVRTDRQPWTIETFAGNSDPAVGYKEGRNAKEVFFKPRNIVFDNHGDLILADRESNTIRRIAIDGNRNPGAIVTIGGRSGTIGFGGDGGPAVEATLDAPRGLGVDWMHNIYIADSNNNRIRRIDTEGIMTTVAGTGDSGKSGEGKPATEIELMNPRHIVFDAAGSAYITDTGSHRILKVANFIEPNPVPVTPNDAEPKAPPADPAPGDPAPGDQPPAAQPPGPVRDRSGYWMLSADGHVYPFGDAGAFGSVAAPTAMDVEVTPRGDGYWVVDAAGRVSGRGSAVPLGTVPAGALARDERVTSLSATPSGHGYWIFTTRGRVFAFGDAAHFGDMAGVTLNGAVLDSVPSRSGRGYYMVASDGGIFAFGDARFTGSMGGKPLNSPVQSLVPDPDGSGYWLVASDGGVFAFDAPFRGSMGAVRLNRPVTGMVAFGNGYLMVGEDGGVFNFSDRPFHGSLAGSPPARPIVAVASLG